MVRSFLSTSSGRKISIVTMLVFSYRTCLNVLCVCVLDMDLKTCKQTFFLLHLCVNFFLSHTHTTPYGHSFHFISSVLLFSFIVMRYISLTLLLLSTRQMYFCLINMYPYLLYFTLFYYTYSHFNCTNDLYVHIRACCARWNAMLC